MDDSENLTLYIQNGWSPHKPHRWMKNHGTESHYDYEARVTYYPFDHRGQSHEDTIKGQIHQCAGSYDASLQIEQAIREKYKMYHNIKIDNIVLLPYIEKE